MKIFCILAVISVIFLGLYLLWLHIKRLYREFDRRETLKEETEKQKELIKGAMSYIRNHYNNDFDSTPYTNIKTKVDFLKPIIENKSDEKKLFYYKRLYESLYDSVYRLKTSYDNVAEIVKPLNTLTTEIVEDHIDYIKENAGIL